MKIGVSTHPDQFANNQVIFPTVEVGGIFDVALIATKRAITGSTYKSCRCVGKKHPDYWRTLAHFEQCQLIGLDFDRGANYIDVILQMDKMKIQYALSTTKSHQKIKHQGTPKEEPACDRFRVLIPCASPTFDPRVVKHNVSKMMEWNTADRQCKDAPRFFKPSPGVIKIVDRGDLYEWDTNIKNNEFNGVLECYGQLGIVPSWLEKEAILGAVSGRNGAVFKLSCKLAKMGFNQAQSVAWFKTTPLGTLGTLPEDRPNELEDAVSNGFAAVEKEKGEMASPIHER